MSARGPAAALAVLALWAGTAAAFDFDWVAQDISNQPLNNDAFATEVTTGGSPAARGSAIHTTTRTKDQLYCRANTGTLAALPRAGQRRGYTIQCRPDGPGFDVRVCHDGACHAAYLPGTGLGVAWTFGSVTVRLALSGCTAAPDGRRCQAVMKWTKTFKSKPRQLDERGESAAASATGAWDNVRSTGIIDPKTGTVVKAGTDPGQTLRAAHTANTTAAQQVNCHTSQQQSLTSSGDITTCDGSATATFGFAGNADKGYRNQPGMPSNHKFDEATQAIAVINAVQKNIEGTPPTLFNGSLVSCTNVLGCGITNSCCCNIGLQFSDTHGPLGCDRSSAKLAAGRRGHMAHQLTNCCISSLPLVGCVKHEQSWCLFESQLAKLIQEQGRAQLAHQAANGQPKAEQVITVPRHAPSGHWQGPVMVNGNHFWAWVFDHGCTQPTPDPALVCRMLDGGVQLAFCPAGGTCPGPPARPDEPTDGDVVVRRLALPVTTPRQPSHALTQDVVVTPSPGCDATECRLTLTVMGTTAAGSTLVHGTLSWPLYTQNEGWQAPVSLGSAWVVSGYAEPLSSAPAMGGANPTAVSIEYAPAGNTGQPSGPWISQSLPLVIPATAPVTLGTSGIKVWGDCRGPYYQCEYHLTATTAVTLKPWHQGCSASGGVVAPDCSGFTLAQFMLLDLGAMDLSAWSASMTPETPAPGPVRNAVTHQANTLKGEAAARRTHKDPDEFKPQGPDYDTSSRGAVVLYLDKTNCTIAIPGDCLITAWMTSNWPWTSAEPSLNTNPVASVTLDWGDGSVETVTPAAIADFNGVPWFKATHTYDHVGQYIIKATYHMPPGDGIMVPRSVAMGHALLPSFGGDPPMDHSHYNDSGIMVGKPGDNYTGSGPPACEVHSGSITFRLSPRERDALAVFKLVEVMIDDMLFVAVNGTPVYAAPNYINGADMLQKSAPNTIQYTTGGLTAACQHSSGSHHLHPSVDLLPHLQTGLNTISLRWAIGDVGEMWVRFETQMAPPSCTGPDCHWRDTRDTHYSEAAVEVWEDTPPVDKTHQDATGQGAMVVLD